MPALLTEVGDVLPRTSTIIIIFLSWNKTREEFLKLARSSGAEVKAIMVTRDNDHRLDHDLLENNIQRVTVSEIEHGVNAL